jgi:CMD domain protein
MSETLPDIIDALAGIAPGSPLHAIRDRRAQARENAQKSYLALFAPEFPGDVTALERHAVATYVAGLHRQPALAEHYGERLRGLDARIADAVAAEVVRGAVEGPYGRYPEGPLSVEDLAGPEARVEPGNAALLGARLTAALEHAHLLVFHPRDAGAAALGRLIDAGWSTPGIVTLSQLVSFLAFQIRVVAGLRALAAHPADARASSRAPVFTGVLSSGHL